MENHYLSIQFKKAQPNDSKLLSKTTFESKKMWNYTDDQMNLWIEELTITEPYIEENIVFKIFDNDKYIGFFSLVAKEEFIEIDHFWLLPKNTRKGYGGKTFNFIKKMAKELDYDILEVYAEPNANKFYEKIGGKKIRSKESKIKGRFLDVYEIKI